MRPTSMWRKKKAEVLKANRRLKTGEHIMDGTCSLEFDDSSEPNINDESECMDFNDKEGNER